MSELVVGSIAGLAANSYEVSVASGSTLDLANAKAASLPVSALPANIGGLIHKETFSGVASVNIDNVFTSNYRNYRVIVQVEPSASNSVLMRLRSGGTTKTTGYYNSHYYTNGSTSFIGQASNYLSSVSGAAAGSISATQHLIASPYVAEETFSHNFTSEGQASANYPYLAIGACQIWDTSLYDGLNFSVASGTITGEVRIYGVSDVEV